MSWIAEAAEKYVAKKTRIDDDRAKIASSRFWDDLAAQIQLELDTINSEPAWQDRLADKPIEVHRAKDGADKDLILKITHPLIEVKIEKREGRVFHSAFAGSTTGRPVFSMGEPVQLIVVGGAVGLNTRSGTLSVARATQHLLNPVVFVLTRI